MRSPGSSRATGWAISTCPGQQRGGMAGGCFAVFTCSPGDEDYESGAYFEPVEQRQCARRGAGAGGAGAAAGARVGRGPAHRARRPPTSTDAGARRRPARGGRRADRAGARRARGAARGGRALARPGLEPAERVRDGRAVRLPGVAGPGAGPLGRRARARAGLRRAADPRRPLPPQRARILGRRRAELGAARRVALRRPRALPVAAQPHRRPAARDRRERRPGRDQLPRRLPARGRRRRRRHAARDGRRPRGPRRRDRRRRRGRPRLRLRRRDDAARRSATSPACRCCSTRCARPGSARPTSPRSRTGTGGACSGRRGRRVDRRRAHRRGPRGARARALGHRRGARRARLARTPRRGARARGRARRARPRGAARASRAPRGGGAARRAADARDHPARLARRAGLRQRPRRRRRGGQRDVAPRAVVGRDRGRVRARARQRRHEGRRDRRAARPGRAAGRGHADAGGRAPVRAVGGGRRPRHVRGARARRPLRRMPDPRADGLRRGLRPGRRAHLPRHRARPCARTRRCGSRAAPRSTATSPCMPRWPSTRRGSTPPSSTRRCARSSWPIPSRSAASRRATGRARCRTGSCSRAASACAWGRIRPRRAPRSRPRCGARTARTRPSRSRGPEASFASGETDPAHPWVERVLAAVRAERGAAEPAGVPWGADMRLFCARGIPTCMVGTNGIELAHAVDERVRVDEVAALARIIAAAVGSRRLRRARRLRQLRH